MEEPRSLQHEEVLAIHRDLIARFGGVPGVRERGLLESALGAPEATFAGQFVHPGLPEMAAAYLYHLVRDHPFVDGNKRIALAACHLFLWLNGLILVTDEETVERVVLDAATGAISEDEVAEFVREHAHSRPATGGAEDPPRE